MTGFRAPEGIDAARVDAWLVGHVPDVTPPFRYELITGGRSGDLGLPREPSTTGAVA